MFQQMTNAVLSITKFRLARETKAMQPQAKNPALTFVNSVALSGAGTLRFRLTPDEVKQLRKAEARGHEEAIKTLLGFLRTPRK
jgi:hypothetical protein